MAKKWILTASSGKALVHSQADLNRRLAAARKAGETVKVEPSK